MKEDDYIGGIKKETYDLLFKDENLPELNEEEAQKGKENDKILDVIAFFTILDDNVMKNKKLKKQLDLDFSKFVYHKKDNRYEYISEDKVIPFEKLSDKIENQKMKKELMSKERQKKCHLKAITLIDIFRKSSFHLKWNIYKTQKCYKI